MGTTLRAIKRVTEVRDKRQDAFYRMRMREHKADQKEEIRATIRQGIQVLAPAAADKERALAVATSRLPLRQQARQQKKQQQKEQVQN
jgi:large subunit ribosomal protein L24e